MFKKKKEAPGRIADTSEHDEEELCELGSAFWLPPVAVSLPSARGVRSQRGVKVEQSASLMQPQLTRPSSVVWRGGRQTEEAPRVSIKTRLGSHTGV